MHAWTYVAHRGRGKQASPRRGGAGRRGTCALRARGRSRISLARWISLPVREITMDSARIMGGGWRWGGTRGSTRAGQGEAGLGVALGVGSERARLALWASRATGSATEPSTENTAAKKRPQRPRTLRGRRAPILTRLQTATSRAAALFLPPRPSGLLPRLLALSLSSLSSDPPSVRGNCQLGSVQGRHRTYRLGLLARVPATRGVRCACGK